MAYYSVSTVTATLVASTAVTAIELKSPAGAGARLVKWWVEFNSVTAGDKNVLVQFGRFSAAVTTLTATTPAPVDYGFNALASQMTAGVNATVEGAGTFNANGEQHSIPANSGNTFWEPEPAAWQLAPSSFWRLRLTPGSAITTATATCGFTWSEM